MKEKTNKQIIFLIQPSLYEQFQKKCESDYKTISQALRDLVIAYVKEEK